MAGEYLKNSVSFDASTTTGFDPPGARTVIVTFCAAGSTEATKPAVLCCQAVASAWCACCRSRPDINTTLLASIAFGLLRSFRSAYIYAIALRQITRYDARCALQILCARLHFQKSLRVLKQDVIGCSGLVFFDGDGVSGVIDGRYRPDHMIERRLGGVPRSVLCRAGWNPWRNQEQIELQDILQKAYA